MNAVLAYGLSVHHFISQVGDYVGFAAIVAVAIMALLLFAHARETADLRRRAEDAEDELTVLHEQVQWLRGAQQSTGAGPPSAAAQQQGAAPPPTVAAPAAAASARPGAPATVPAPASARTASGAGRSVAATGTATAATAAAAAAAAPTGQGSGATVAPVAPPPGAERAAPALPGAPVGVGAPALSSATKLIPPTDEELRAVAAAAAAREAGTGSPVAEPGDGDDGRYGPPVAPPPATVAAGNGNQPGRAAAPDSATRGAGGRSGQQGAVVSPRRNYASSGDDSGGGGGRRRIRGAVIAAGTLLVAAIVVVVVLVVGNNSSSSGHHANAATPTHAAGTAHKAAKGKARFASVNVDPTTVTVSVLNGTMTTNLAADVSSKLTAKGFQAGSTGNAADQSIQSTVVGYVPGVQNAKNDAYAVAHTLGLKQTSVKPVSSANQTVACSGETNCPDQVIVTVGADLNSDAT
jgi:LytR cell envelope-related transcriptional attenuator